MSPVELCHHLSWIMMSWTLNHGVLLSVNLLLIDWSNGWTSGERLSKPSLHLLENVGRSIMITIDLTTTVLLCCSCHG